MLIDESRGYAALAAFCQSDPDWSGRAGRLREETARLCVTKIRATSTNILRIGQEAGASDIHLGGQPRADLAAPWRILQPIWPDAAKLNSDEPRRLPKISDRMRRRSGSTNAATRISPTRTRPTHFRTSVVRQRSGSTSCFESSTRVRDMDELGLPESLKC